MIVVDASIFVSWLLNEYFGSSQDAVWDLLASQVAFVPAHWPDEVANALRRAVRRKRIAAADIGAVVTQLKAFDIRLGEQRQLAHITLLVEQALASDPSVHDLQYLNLARAYDVPLATIDVAMRSAALEMNLVVLPKQ